MLFVNLDFLLVAAIVLYKFTIMFCAVNFRRIWNNGENICSLQSSLMLFYLGFENFPTIKVWLIDCKLKKELLTLKEIISRQWSKTAELEALKKECADLQRRIDESLKAVGNGETTEQPKPNMPNEIAA